MGIRAMNFVKDNRRAGGFAQAVLAYLADCMNDRTGRCFPLREKIAEYFSSEDDRCTVKRVERALARLRTLGFIESKRVPYTRQTATGQEGGWQNSYVLVGFIPGDSNPVGVTNISGVTPKTDVTPAVDGGNPQNVQGVTPTVDRGHPHRGGIKQKELEENQKEPVSSMRTSSADASASASQTQPPEMSDEEIASLFADAQIDVGSKPDTVKAEAPKHRTTTPRKKPATRCPFGPDASIPPEYLEIAQKAGIGDPQQVFSAFVNHAIAHDRSLVVWPAGFRTWCSNELRYHPNQTPKPKPLHQRTAADYDW